MELLAGSGYTQATSGQTCYSLRCVPQGLGQVWEALTDARATIEREINSANDNPLIDPDTGDLYKAGNFYGGHIARLLDTWKIDFATMANWGNAVMALLVDDRFNAGLPVNLTPEPGVNCGFKGMQLSVTSLACAVRQMAGPSTIHSTPTEQYNQDIVSLGTHASLTAADIARLLRDTMAITLLSTVQAIDLREGGEKLGAGTRPIYRAVRGVSRFVGADRSLDPDIRAVGKLIELREIPVLN
jgi:phenylalanine ammonia-lyase